MELIEAPLWPNLSELRDCFIMPKSLSLLMLLPLRDRGLFSTHHHLLLFLQGPTWFVITAGRRKPASIPQYCTGGQEESWPVLRAHIPVLSFIEISGTFEALYKLVPTLLSWTKWCGQILYMKKTTTTTTTNQAAAALYGIVYKAASLGDWTEKARLFRPAQHLLAAQDKMYRQVAPSSIANVCAHTIPTYTEPPIASSSWCLLVRDRILDLHGSHQKWRMIRSHANGY